MILNGYRLEESVSRESGLPVLLVRDVADLSPYGFDLAGTFESGQCFRWQHIGDGRYAGIAAGKSVIVSMVRQRHLQIENASAEDFRNFWHRYFDLGSDYSVPLQRFHQDPFMQKAIEFSGGVRLLQQEFEETLFSFILSSQNNIPRIKSLVRQLCSDYGEPLPSPPGGFSFPAASVLAERMCARPECRAGALCDRAFAGYRCPYIARTAKLLVDRIFVPDPERLAAVPAAEAAQMLKVLPGVGDKVADCVLLYSGIRRDICPVDTWVARIIRSVYLKDEADIKAIRGFTQDYFGNDAGLAQLWFFHYARTNGIPDHPDLPD